MSKMQILAAVVSLLLLGLTVELIRRRRLKEEYALLWLFASLAVFVFSLAPQLFIEEVSRLFGIRFYLTALGALAFIFLLAIVFHYSMVISELAEKNAELAQRLAITDWKLRQLARENQREGVADGAGGADGR